MDWVHCNVCYFQPGQLPKRDFHLTNCGHIFCQYCENSGTIEKCKMCGVKCTTTPLSSQMNREIRVYFEDPEDMQENLLKAMQFQRSHRLRMNEYYRKLVGKYERLKLSYQRLEDRARQQQEELDNLKENRNQNIFTPPPPRQPAIPLFCKNSSASRAILNYSQQRTPPNNIPQSPLGFMTSQQYRTPLTPASDISSISPVSVASSNRSGQAAGGRVRQSPYGPGLTPPFNRLRALSVNPLMSRNPASRHDLSR